METIINFFKKNWLKVAIVLLVIIVVVIIRRKNRKKDNYSATIDNGQSGGDEQSWDGDQSWGGGDTPSAKAKFPLQPRSLAGSYSNAKGSMGSQIKTLQMIYNANATTGTPLNVDGKYGPKSEGAFTGFFYDMIASNGTINESQYEQILKKYN